MNAIRSERQSLDEVFDAVVCRPLGRKLAKMLEPTSLSANHVSALSGLFGVLAGVGLAFPSVGPLLGSVSLFAMMIFDCADGELARLRGGGDWRGRMIDGLADLATSFSVHLGMLIHLGIIGFRVGPHRLSGWELFFFALTAGVSMAWNSAVVDNVKQRLKGCTVDQQVLAEKPEMHGLFDKFLYWCLSRYLRSMQKSSRSCPGAYSCFRRIQWVGPTHHHVAMLITGIAMMVWPSAPAAYFFWAIVPANLFLLVALHYARREHDSQSFADAASVP